MVRAALLYVLRCLCGSGLPLNEGVLRRVDLVLPPQSVLDPPPGAAVVGGNVETSQQLVDLLFYALGERAGSQGTMNNLTIGGEGWSFYETIGGGGGASPGAAGLHGRQLHMTNTRATDVEVLEARLPLRLRELSYRQGSGGVGEHAGGMGLLRELELLAPGRASLLASGYASGGRGLNAGQGQARRDWLFTGGQWVPWDGGSADLAVGDRIRIETPGGGACTPADWMS